MNVERRHRPSPGIHALAVSALMNTFVLACGSGARLDVPRPAGGADGSVPDAASAGAARSDATSAGASGSDATATVSAGTVVIARSAGTPISPFAFGNNYFNWVDYNHDGLVGILGTEAPVKALHLNLLVGSNNQSDANAPELFDQAQIDRFVTYARAIGAEPLMIAPVYGNNVDAGPTSAQGAADLVTYVNGTKGYGVQYWTIGDEVDGYPQFFPNGGYTITTAAQYCEVFKSYAQAMKAANAATGSGVELKFVGPELAWQYIPGHDWLSPFLDGCKDYIDVVSIHAYGFSANTLTLSGALNDVTNFRSFVAQEKALVAAHARPGTPLAITEANISYDWDPAKYTPDERNVGPGTFYAAMWDADRMGAALEANLWNFSFWELAETVQSASSSVFGFLQTDPSLTPPTYKETPEYHVQQMFNVSFTGTTVIPSGVPALMSVYASYDATKGSTAVMVINKDTVRKSLTLAVDNLTPQTLSFAAMSINIVTVPDDPAAKTQVNEYSAETAGAAAVGADGGIGTPALGCQTSKPPASPLIADFSGGDYSAGDIPISNGGTYTYGPPAPTIAQTGGALHVTLDAPGTASAQYLGFGIYFNDCMDGRAYSGVKFDIGGTLTGCTVQYAFNYREDDANATDPKGSCAAASCYAGMAALPVPATATSTSMAYSAVSGGVPIAGPLTATAQTYLTGVQWQFVVPPGSAACVADLTIDNVTFY